MRYSVVRGTLQQVRSVGAVSVRDASNVGVIFANLTKDQVDKLKAMGCVVERVAGIKAAVMPPVAPPGPVAGRPIYSLEQMLWATGLDQMRGLTTPPLLGRGFAVAFLDTGIRETHELINGRVAFRKNYTAGPMRDGFNHGTGTASIAVAVAPECTVFNLKVLDDEGVGTEEMVVLAIDDCLAMHNDGGGIAPAVINMSLGSDDDGNPNNPMRVACRAATERGIWVVAAAGNGGPEPGTILSPACEKYVDAVGSASYEPFGVSEFSSRGPTVEGLTKPDELIYGENIIVASSGSDTATAAKSGTSFSAPFISGIDVLYLEVLTVPEVQDTIKQLLIQYGYPEEELLTAIGPRELGQFLPLACVKPQGIPAEKDNSYGWGLYFIPHLLQSLGLTRPAIDTSTLLGTMVTLGVLGVVMGSMTKFLR